MSVAVVKDKASAVAAVMSLVSSWRPPLRRTVGCYLCFSLDSLATVQIMVGLFNIGLGPGRPNTGPYDVNNLYAAYWLGAVSIIVGIMTFLSCIRYCLRIFSAIFNIVGAIFSIVGIVLYAIDLSGASFTWMCDDQVLGGASDKCIYLSYIAQDMLRGMDITLIILISLQLFAHVTAAVLIFSGFLFRGNQEDVRGSFQTFPQEVKVLVISPAV
ncbi:uncharacterized protein LOC114478213 isoform X1 [Gouania willdenowi]|nr:uncharacterized protein LOC114478213 isoform X1 [Gouania willdenowi]XP_028326905.1 uncharacterized protein LOC114478213 isoform X1 [Gouania willdenowi]